MQQYLIAPLLLAVAFLVLFGLAEYLYRIQKVRAEFTRKLVHFGTGIITLLFPVLLVNHWQVLFLCSSFLLLLVTSLKFNLLPSINAIDRQSYGSLLYPVAVYGTYLVYTLAGKGDILFYLPILILAVCDPVAALIGKRCPRGSFRIGAGHKTASGSLAFFISCVVLSSTMLVGTFPEASFFWQLFIASILISLCLTAVEAVGSHGVDNLLLPLSAAGALYLLL